MPKARSQPAKPETAPPPPQEKATLEEKTGVPATPEEPEEPKGARRPSQTQQTSEEGRVVEGQVPKIELLKPEPIEEEALLKLNVYQRWNRCIDEIGLVPKRGWNDHHRYWFTTDADLMAFVGPLFAKYHLVVIPSIDVDKVMRFEPNPGSKQWLTRVPMHVRIINADKPDEVIEVDWIGEGADTVDKGVYKAFTGGLKYFYMKLLQVATGDDPELFTQTDRLGAMAAEDAASSRGSQRPERRQVDVRPSNAPQPAKGGRQAGATEVQIRQVRALARSLNYTAEDVALFIDGILETTSVNVLDGIEDPEIQRDRLIEWMKTRSGTDIGKVIYAMGEETKRAAAQKSEEAVAEASNPYGGAPENEAADEPAPESVDDLLEQAAHSEQ